MVLMIMIILLNNILSEGMLLTNVDVDSNECLAANCEESAQISYLNKNASKLEEQVVDQQKKTTSLQEQLTDLSTKITLLLEEVKTVNSKVDWLTARLDVLEKNPSVEKIYTNESSITIPGGKCSWVQVYVDVSGFRNDGKGYYYLYAILFQDGSPVYGGSGSCAWTNPAATGFTSTSLDGGTTSRIFSLPVKPNGTILKLILCMGGYRSPARHMTVLCFAETNSLERI